MVIARFLLDMLAGTNSVGDEFGRVIRVTCQARDAGWLTDDLALTCETYSGQDRAIGISIKSDEQVTSAGFPPDFVDLAWSQWRGERTSRAFRQGTDAIVLVAARLDRSVDAAWSSLHMQILEATTDSIVARLAPDTGDGVQSSELHRKLVRSFAEPAQRGQAATTAETVRLLHDVRLLEFDFNKPTSRDRAAALRLCQDILTAGDPAEGQRLWLRLVGIADGIRGVGGFRGLGELLRDLRDEFGLKAHPDYRRDWELLRREADEALADIETKIAEAAQLPRLEIRADIQNWLTVSGACLLVGESGSGKSALSKEIAATYPNVVWLTAAQLDHSTSAQFEMSIGLRHPLGSILRASPVRSLVVLDSLESFSDQALKMAARLIKELADAHAMHVHIIMTAQVGLAERVIGQLRAHGVPGAKLVFYSVGRPTEGEVRTLLLRLPSMRGLALRPELRSVLTNLKILGWLARIFGAGAAATQSNGLSAIIDQLWDFWTEGSSDGLARSHILMDLAVKEANAMTRGIPRIQIVYSEQSMLRQLERSDLVRLRDDRVTFAHDLLGDWARMRVLAAETPSAVSISHDRIRSPRWQQAIRLFGQRLLERSGYEREKWQHCVEAKSDGSAPDELVRDLFLDALFLAGNAVSLFEQNWALLAANGGQLLNRMLHRFLFIGTLPDPRLLAVTEDEEVRAQAEHLMRLPFAPYWGPVLTALHAHRGEVATLAPHNAAKICALWLNSVPTEIGQGRAMPWRREAAELAVEIAREIQGRNAERSYTGGGDDHVVYEALLYAARDIPDEVGALCLELACRRDVSPGIQLRPDGARRKRMEEQAKSEAPGAKQSLPAFFGLRRRKRKPWPDGPRGRVDREFVEACLGPNAFASVVQAVPDVALEVLLAVSIEEPQDDDPLSRSSLPECGLSYWPTGDPPAYFRGPFIQFFRFAPQHALSFVIRLTNFGTRQYVHDRVWLDIVVKDEAKRWYGDSNIFRWNLDWPMSRSSQIQSALMALEQWLYEQIDQSINIEPWVRRIIDESESLAFAGILFEVGKRAPELFLSALSPLFSAWLLWDWDFQLTTLRSSDQSPTGYWGNQPRQLLERAIKWRQLPHRATYLFGPDGPIARTMLGHETLWRFFNDVRAKWSLELDGDEEPDHLRHLVERINPANYTFERRGNEVVPIDFQWPAELVHRNEEQIKQITKDQAFTTMPFRCRRLLDGGNQLPDEQASDLWNYLQKIDAAPPPRPRAETGDPHSRFEDVFYAGIAVLLTAAFVWLARDDERVAWCREKLQALVDHPPPRGRHESELSVGNLRWDAFAAECGVKLMATDQSDKLARTLVAIAVTALNYNTTALVMARAAQVRGQLGRTFDQMIAFSLRWAALRPQQPHPTDEKFEEERTRFAEGKRDLVLEFETGSMPSAIPNLRDLNDQACGVLDLIWEKRFPGSKFRRTRKAVARPHSREELSPERLGLDERVMQAALGWLDIRDAASIEERETWLSILRSCFDLTLQTVPIVQSVREQEIDGLPTDFDHWVLQRTARTIPCLQATEQPDEFWRPLLDRGPSAHNWIERFYWHWFTDGLKNSRSVPDFVRIWRSMVAYALQLPSWDPAISVRHDLESVVVGLLCFDARWSAALLDEANADIISSLKDVYADAFRHWGEMPRVVRGFTGFAVEPGAKAMLLAGIPWVLTVVREYGSYDWKYGLEESVIAFLHTCWLRESQRILNDAALKDPFFALLAIVVSRRSHAAIALNDRVAASLGGPA